MDDYDPHGLTHGGGRIDVSDLITIEEAKELFPLLRSLPRRRIIDASIAGSMPPHIRLTSYDEPRFSRRALAAWCAEKLAALETATSRVSSLGQIVQPKNRKPKAKK